VVASDSGSLREVVAEAGILVPEGDVAGFARELRRLLEEPAYRNELRARGRARAQEDFSWEAVADQVDAMYRDAIDARRSAEKGVLRSA
jgi:glycosyltransferase involved in cell wall biosynthesis